MTRPAVAVLLAAAVGPAVPGPAADPAPTHLVYLGTYIGPKSRGIYVSRFDAVSGRLSPPELAAETEGPSFLALHPTRPLLYAVNEVGEFEGKPAGSVTAFAIDASGALRALNRVSSEGAHPCHLVVDRTGRHVLVANYTGGSLASLPVREDGSLGPAAAVARHRGRSVNPERQEAPHAHAVEVDAANRVALAADLGLDQVLAYRFDPDRGTLEPADPPHAAVRPGAGPRHLAFGRDGRHVYVLNELDVTVTAFRYEDGRMTEEATVSALPAGVKPGPEDSGAEVQVHPSGRFLYASLRGPDQVAVFSVDGGTGRLSLAQHVATGGRTPRSFSLDPSGRWLLAANQRSDSVTVFRVDPDTGRLSPTGQAVEVGSPVSVVFRPLVPPSGS